jgi:hypothetical protein
MVSKQRVLSLLPPFKNEYKLVTWRQNTRRLTKEIIRAHEQYETDYDLIYKLFDCNNVYETCRGLWDFCKYNIPYTVESEEEQSVKSPAAILTNGQKTDCKHYSLFIGGVLGAIKANENDPWEWCYRFVSYDASEEIGHVFVVVKTGSAEIWIDPVLTGFNQKKQPTYYIDKQPAMALYSISGMNEGNGKSVTASNPERGFLLMVNNNVLSLKTLLNDNPSITNGAFKDWYISKGFDFDHLKLVLNG